jgi:hypothetical protein
MELRVPEVELKRKDGLRRLLLRAAKSVVRMGCKVFATCWSKVHSET